MSQLKATPKGSDVELHEPGTLITDLPPAVLALIFSQSTLSTYLAIRLTCRVWCTMAEAALPKLQLTDPGPNQVNFERAAGLFVDVTQLHIDCSHLLDLSKLAGFSRLCHLHLLEVQPYHLAQLADCLPRGVTHLEVASTKTHTPQMATSPSLTAADAWLDLLASAVGISDVDSGIDSGSTSSNTESDSDDDSTGVPDTHRQTCINDSNTGRNASSGSSNGCKNNTHDGGRPPPCSCFTAVTSAHLALLHDPALLRTLPVLFPNLQQLNLRKNSAPMQLPLAAVWRLAAALPHLTSLTADLEPAGQAEATAQSPDAIAAAMTVHLQLDVLLAAAARSSAHAMQAPAQSRRSPRFGQLASAQNSAGMHSLAQRLQVLDLQGLTFQQLLEAFGSCLPSLHTLGYLGTSGGLLVKFPTSASRGTAVANCGPEAQIVLTQQSCLHGPAEEQGLPYGQQRSLSWLAVLPVLQKLSLFVNPRNLLGQEGRQGASVLPLYSGSLRHLQLCIEDHCNWCALSLVGQLQKLDTLTVLCPELAQLKHLKGLRELLWTAEAGTPLHLDLGSWSYHWSYIAQLVQPEHQNEAACVQEGSSAINSSPTTQQPRSACALTDHRPVSLVVGPWQAPAHAGSADDLVKVLSYGVVVQAQAVVDRATTLTAFQRLQPYFATDQVSALRLIGHRVSGRYPQQCEGAHDISLWISPASTDAATPADMVSRTAASSTIGITGDAHQTPSMALRPNPLVMTFNKLRSLNIGNAHSLTSVWMQQLGHQLPCLQQLSLTNCISPLMSSLSVCSPVLLDLRLASVHFLVDWHLDCPRLTTLVLDHCEGQCVRQLASARFATSAQLMNIGLLNFGERFLQALLNGCSLIHLPALEELRIRKSSVVRSTSSASAEAAALHVEVACTTGHAQLRRLELRNLPNLKKLVVQKVPRLAVLVVHNRVNELEALEVDPHVGTQLHGRVSVGRQP